MLGLTACGDDQTEIIELKTVYDELPKKGSVIEGYKQEIAVNLGNHQYLEIEFGYWPDERFELNGIATLPTTAKFTQYRFVEEAVPNATGTPSLNQNCLTCLAAPLYELEVYELMSEALYDHVHLYTEDNTIILEILNYDERLNAIEKIEQISLSTYKKENGEVCIDKLQSQGVVDIDGDGIADPINDTTIYDYDDYYYWDYSDHEYALGVLKDDTQGCNILSATLHINQN